MNKRVIFSDKSDSLLQSYFRDISKYKILDNEEINKLIVKAQNGDEKAREKVITSNLRFVVTIAKQFQNRGIPLMDLISSGLEGLCKSVNKFDPTRGVKFLNYSAWWIKQCIYTTIYWYGREIRLPVTQHLKVIQILRATNEFIKKNGRNPTTNELHTLTNIPEKQIDYLAQFSNRLVSVDDFIGGDEENSQVCDVIPDGEPPLDEQINKSFINRELCKCLDVLPVREHDIIIMLFGIGMNPMPKQEVGDMFGIGVERVRQIKEKALDRIRKRCNLQLSKLI